MYCSIREAQREREHDVSSRIVALCDAANIAGALAEEIAALRAEVVFSLAAESSYTVLA